MNVKRKIKDIAKQVLPFGVVEQIKFRNESRLFRRGLPKDVKGQSVALFTLNKCASTFTPQMFLYFNRKANRLTHVDWEGYFYNQGVDFFDLYVNDLEKFFPAKGVLVAPLRRYYPSKALDAFAKVLIIRDPRDIVTSNYFSMGWAHSTPFNQSKRDTFHDRRERVQKMSIDEYVLEYHGVILRRFQEYVDMCREHQVTQVKYETLMEDFPTAVRAVAGAFNLEADEVDIENLRRMGGYDKPIKESVHSHTRKRTPGDYKAKLSSDSITLLNERMGEVIEFFQYKG